MPMFRHREPGSGEHHLHDPSNAPGGHRDRDALAGRLVAAAPSVGPRLAQSLRPAVRFAVEVCQEFEIPVGASKFGGAPDLPHDVDWPTWTNPSGQTRPLNFFAQVNLELATAAAPAPLGLPEHGLLSFFADFDLTDQGIIGLHPWERDGSVVLHIDPDAHLERTHNDVAPLLPAALHAIGSWTWSHVGLESIEVSDEEYDALDALELAYERSLGTSVHLGWKMDGRHQLGGHGNYIQHPVEEEVVQAVHGCFEGAFDAEKWAKVRHEVDDWRVLLQLDSDRDLDVMWGDVGTLWWAARQADVDAGDWAAGMFNFQCS
jgi:uncharacterized protein YwqG